MADYLPDPERSVDYKLLDPGFSKVFAFGTQFGQIGYIISDSWEDAYEELLDHAYEVDGPCDHGDDPELKALVEAAGRAIPPAQDEWEACWRWVDEHCDCTPRDRGYVWMVDNWWHRETAIKPLDLVTALRAITRDPELNERLNALVEWYTEED